MRTVYKMLDRAGREMFAEMKKDKLKVTMYFTPQENLTLDEIFEKLGWTLLEKKVYNKLTLVEFDERKTDGNS